MSDRVAPGSQHEIAASLVGCSIVGTQWIYDELADHEALYARLDDGRLLRFRSWGNEAWGVILEDVTEAFERLNDGPGGAE